ncbi:MAG: hypothetical protein ABH848_03545 [Candidatus Omnitrophota bacterium]
MSGIFKIIFIIILIAAIVLAGFAFLTYQQKQKEYQKRLLLEDKISSIMKDKRKLEKEVFSIKTEKDKIDSEYASLRSNLEILSLELREARAKRRTAALQEKELEDLKQTLRSKDVEAQNTAKKLQDLQISYQRLNQDHSKLRQEKTSLERKLVELERRPVDLDTIVLKEPEEEVIVEKRAPSRRPEPKKDLLRGSVVVVNKEYGFVVTDLGFGSGIEQGMYIEIRDSRNLLLGEAEIDKVYETMSSANLLEGADINTIKRGNIVIESR